MTFEYYMHGVPYGFNYAGPPLEHDVFLKRYYGDRRGINEMRIEVIPTGGKTYFYYTYIIGKNVIDGQNGRVGAYLGITVRIDAYYKRARNLYYLLDSFFHSYMGSRVLSADGKFNVQDFDREKSLLKALDTLVKSCFSQEDIISLTAVSKPLNKEKIAKLNLLDADDDKVCETLKRVGEVSISDSYAFSGIANERSLKEREIQNLREDMQKQIAKTQEEKDSEIKRIEKTAEGRIKQAEFERDAANTKAASAQAECERLNGQIIASNQKVENLEEEMKAKEAELNAAQKEIERLTQEEAALKTSNETFAQKLSEIRRIVEYLPPAQEPGGGTGKIDRTSKGFVDNVRNILPFVNIGLLVIIFILVLLSLFNSCGDTSPSVPKTESETAVEPKDELRDVQNVGRKSQHSGIGKTDKPTARPESPGSYENNEYTVPEDFASDINREELLKSLNPRIDVKEFTGNKRSFSASAYEIGTITLVSNDSQNVEKLNLTCKEDPYFVTPADVIGKWCIYPSVEGTYTLLMSFSYLGEEYTIDRKIVVTR